MGAHAKLAPSAASTWINCSASIRASEGVQDKETTFAYEGTVMHEVRAWALEHMHDPMERVGDLMRVGTGKLLHITEERARALLPGIEWLRDMFGGAALPQAKFKHFEGKLFFDVQELSECYGTVDFAALHRDGLLVVSDLKFGAGVPVWPERNKQQMIYALLVLYNMTKKEVRAVDKVIIHIDQPRIANAGGIWTTTPDRLFRWMDDILLPAVEATQVRNPKFNPSAEACRWCNAKVTCPARAEWVRDNLRIADIMRRDPGKKGAALSTKALVEFVAAEDEIKAALAEARAFLIDDYKAGRNVPGKKVILAQDGHRKWRDKAEAEKALVNFLGDDAFIKTLASPAEAERRLPRQHHKLIAEMAERPPPVPKLVSEHDARAPMPTVKSMFKDERVTS